MTDKEYWKCYNPKHWDKDTWVCGALTVVAMFMLYFIIVIFH